MRLMNTSKLFPVVFRFRHKALEHMEYFAACDMKADCDIKNVNLVTEFDLHLEQLMMANFS
jgi:hypothetical protein